jgi:endoglucanase
VTGDPVKYGLPLATSMSMLAWSYVEHKDAYVEAGSSTQVEEAIRSAAEYIMSCHISRDPANQMFVAQVGAGSREVRWPCCGPLLLHVQVPATLPTWECPTLGKCR